MSDNRILVGGGDQQVFLEPRYANRHGLIAGATGTGKTVTMQVLAEQFSALGVPVFLADIKGDLTGLCTAAETNSKLLERAARIGVEPYEPKAQPTVFWDVFGEQGHPVRTTVTELGPVLLSQMLELNDTQEGVINVAFRVADEQGLLLLDLPDLRALLTHVAENRETISAELGLVSPQSIAAIQRRLLVLEEQGADHFLGEPALDIRDLMRQDLSGRGVINVLAANRLFAHPRLYGMCLLWLLAELFEELPEVGDPDQPRLVFFFDEAHILFDDTSAHLKEQIEKVVRLIRSKGVGVFFVTQNPLDLPDDVLGQLGNRIQHALRAFTPRDQKAVRAAAQTFRRNPELDTETVITQLGVGEALVSMLEAKGVPGVVQRCLIRPPLSKIGPAPENLVAEARQRSPVGGRYDTRIDRESAYEILTERAAKAAAEAERQRAEQAQQRARKPARGPQRQSYGEAITKSTLRSLGSQIGRSLGQVLLRGVLGSLRR
jgi:DNA helicase HerA-like ATPase